MKRLKKYLGLIGLTAMLGFSNAAYAVCGFNPGVPIPPDGVSDLSGQGNFACDVFTGPTGVPMVPVDVQFTQNLEGTWNWEMTTYVPGTIVPDTPDHIVLFPQGQGARCDFQYLSINATEGTELDIGGRVDTRDSIACTDRVANSDEVEITEEPDLVTTVGDACDVTLKAKNEDGNVVDRTTEFAFFTGANRDGSLQAICNIGGNQKECVRGCPGFVDVTAKLKAGTCLANTDGSIDIIQGTERCAPCLTAAEAKLNDSRFDTGGLQLCWEFANSVDEDPLSGDPRYTPHRSLRHQTTETNVYNECYETTTTINFFGREITKTVTTCD